MNKYYLSLFLLFVTFGIKAQVETKYYSSGKNSELSKRVESFTKYAITKSMPSFELTDCYLDECLDKDTDIPYQFGFAFDVEYTLDDGLWQDVEDGRVWTIKIVSSGALSLNFILDNFSLPQGGTLEIVNNECDVLYGPVFNDAIPSSGHSFFVDSSGWQYGIYIARAIVNGEILTSKFNHVK